MRRLIFITQRVDPADPVLAATLPMIRALAERVDELVVLAQSARAGSLPPDVPVHTFGGATQATRGLRFERALVSALRPRPDAVIAHMIPLYVLMAAPLTRPLRIPLVLWYTHWKSHRVLRLAERLANVVTSVDRRSFPLDSHKLRAIGHGIDVGEFSCADRPAHEGLHALVLGRYSPAKGIETILRGIQLARAEGLAVDVELHGAALSELERAHRRELEQHGFTLGDAVQRSTLPSLLTRADLLINNMQAGSPDKVVYEAAASCLPVLASNPVFDGLLEGFDLMFDRDDPRDLAERLHALARLTADERSALGRTLRERVERAHSVQSWADGILAAAAA